MSRFTINYLSLNFYAVRHNIRVKDLSWAILEISDDDCECWRHPALKIKGREAYIDIYEDKYIRFDSFLNFRKYTFFDAKLRGHKLTAVVKCETYKEGFYTLTIDMKDMVGSYYRFRTFDSPNFIPYKLNLDKSIDDDLAAFLQKEKAFEFFANRFWITKEQLSWGVLEVTTDENFWTFPVLRVNVSRVYIDIYDAEISSCRMHCGVMEITYPAYIDNGKLYYEKKMGEGFTHSITLDIDEISRKLFCNYLYLR